MICKKHIPNLLTFARFAAAGLLIPLWYAPAPWGLWLPLVLVLAASITDFLDGYLARKWQVESGLGRLLDPNADKLLMAVAMVLLASSGLASAAAVALIMCRELFVSALREHMAGKGITVHVTKLAKWKTASQMVAILVLLYAHACGCEIAAQLGAGLLWIAAALTLMTGWDYWRGARAHLKD